MSDDSLSLRWPGGQLDADAQGPVTIGRDPDSTIVLESPAVSRRHGEVVFADHTWWYSDLGSSQGSFVDGVGVDRVALARVTRVVLGRGPEAVVVELVPPSPGGLVPTAAAPWAGGQVLPQTRPAQVQRPPVGPTVLREDPAGPVGPAVRVEVEGQTRTVPAGGRLTVGREPGLDLVLRADSVSRQHLVVEQTPAGWGLRDLGSSAGTWLGEVRVSAQLLTGRQTFRLGDRVQGALLTTEVLGGAPVPPVPPIPRRSRRGPVLALVGALALVLAVGGFVGYRLLRTSDTDLARATVKVSLTVGGENAGSGSGTVIDKRRGLILTNAHVAAGESPGYAVNERKLGEDLDPQADGIVISVTDGLQKTAEPRFRAKLVAADGYLDLAVVQITETITGAQVEPDDLAALTEIEMGDSDSADSGDRVQLVGYPGLADSNAPTLTRGIVSGVQTDPRLRSNRAWLNTDAQLNHGNSGGLAADSRGRIIGVPTLILLDDTGGVTTSTLFAFRPVNFAKPLIEAAQTGKPYVSPWTKPAPPSAKVSAYALAATGSGTVSTSCAQGPQTPGHPSIGVQYTGFGGGENTDLLATLSRPSADGTTWTTVGKASTLYAGFPFALPDSGCLTLTFISPQPDETFPAGPYRLRIGLGGSLTTIASFDLAYPGSTG